MVPFFLSEEPFHMKTPTYDTQVGSNLGLAVPPVPGATATPPPPCTDTAFFKKFTLDGIG